MFIYFLNKFQKLLRILLTAYHFFFQSVSIMHSEPNIVLAVPQPFFKHISLCFTRSNTSYIIGNGARRKFEIIEFVVRHIAPFKLIYIFYYKEIEFQIHHLICGNEVI